MSEEEYKRFRQRAYKVAYYRLRNRDHAEDVASLVITNWLTYEQKHGVHISQTINQAVTDAIRTLFGGMTRSEARSVGNKYATSFEEMGDRNLAVAAPKEREDIYKMIAPYIPGRHNLQQRAMLILHVKWGFNTVDLEEVFAVSASRVSQVLKKVMLEIKDEIRKKTTRA